MYDFVDRNLTTLGPKIIFFPCEWGRPSKLVAYTYQSSTFKQCNCEASTWAANTAWTPGAALWPTRSCNLMQSVSWVIQHFKIEQISSNGQSTPPGHRCTLFQTWGWRAQGGNLFSSTMSIRLSHVLQPWWGDDEKSSSMRRIALSKQESSSRTLADQSSNDRLRQHCSGSRWLLQFRHKVNFTR